MDFGHLKKKILLTGSTGVVGSAVVFEILSKTNHELYLPIRSKKGKSSEERFLKTIQFYDPQFNKTLLGHRIHVFEADLTQDFFGLNKTVYDQLIQTIDHIVHSAASVELHTTISEALKNSLAPTQNILKFQSQVMTIKECPLEYISTVGVLGRSTQTLVEKKVDFIRSYHNAYEEAKSVSEELVFKSIRESNLPIIIHRPSMVVGHSQTGKIIHEQIFYFLLKFISGEFTFGLPPQIEKLKLDTIPIDTVAQIIIGSIHHNLPKGTVLHHCSGPKVSIEVSYLQKLLVNQNFIDIKLPLSLIKFYFGFLHFIFVIARKNKSIKKILVLKNILEYAMNTQNFSNDLTKNIISIWGLSIPNPKDYLARVVVKAL